MADDVVLACEFIERSGAHACGEWLDRRQAGFALSCPEIGHVDMVRAREMIGVAGLCCRVQGIRTIEWLV